MPPGLCLRHGRAKLAGLGAFGAVRGHGAGMGAAGEDVAEIGPAEVLTEVIIICQHVVKTVALGGHEQDRAAAVAAQQVAVVLLQREQTVDGGAQLAAEVPVIERAGQDDYVAAAHGGVNFVHVVALHTGVLAGAVPAEAAETAVDIHAVKMEFLHLAADAARTFGKGAYQRGRASGTPGGAVEYHYASGHGVRSSRPGRRPGPRRRSCLYLPRSIRRG